MMTDLKVQVTTARQLLGLKLAVFTRNTASTPHCLLLELGENCQFSLTWMLELLMDACM